MLVTGKAIYANRPDLFGLKFYLCRPCDAYVGCHKGTTPLGRLANAELRAAKSRAHLAFDPLWKEKYFRSRTRAYNWLAQQLKINASDCHIGMFDLDMCSRVVSVTHALRCQLSNNKTK